MLEDYTAHAICNAGTKIVVFKGEVANAFEAQKNPIPLEDFTAHVVCTAQGRNRASGLYGSRDLYGAGMKIVLED